MIGGGGKISGAVMLELLERQGTIGSGEIALYGRSRGKIDKNLGLAESVCPAKERDILLRYETRLEHALAGADVVLFGATSGLEDTDGFESMGVSNASLILSVTQSMSVHCPDAWLLVLTNPPDIPLGAAHLRFGSKKMIGLCNAAIFARKVLSGFLKLRHGFQEILMYSSTYSNSIALFALFLWLMGCVAHFQMH